MKDATGLSMAEAGTDPGQIGLQVTIPPEAPGGSNLRLYSRKGVPWIVMVIPEITR